jgi:hypothetical protein
MELALIAMLPPVVVLGLIRFVPNVIRYSEKIVVNAPMQQVYDNIRFQERLMQWSAWPEATGATCSLEHEDGMVGARTVFFNQGKRFGHQEIIGLEVNRRIALTKVSDSPLKHVPYLTFALRQLSRTQTEVTLDFVNTYQRPFHIPARLFGIVR